MGRSRSRLHLGVALWWCAVLVLTAAAVRLVVALRAAGLPNDGDADMLASVVAAVGGAAVAAGIVLRTPSNPVGWLLLGLFSMFALDGVASYYPAWAEHTGRAGAGLVAGLEQPMWVLELTVLGLALLLVPDGRPPSARWRWAPRALLVLAPLTFLAVLVVPDGGFTGPSAGIDDPFGVAALDSTLGHVVRAALAISTEWVVVACVVSLVFRFRHGDTTTMRQLGWVLLGATTVPVFMVALFVSHLAEGPTGPVTTLVESVGFDAMLLGIPLGIALAMARYRLYSVDAVVDSTLAWLAVSGLLLLGLTAVVLLLGLLAGAGPSRSPAVVAMVTGGAVLLARPLHRLVQQRINHRFHRRSFDAVREVTSYVDRLRRGEASLDELEMTLRHAVADPGLTILVPVGDAWVRPDGRQAPTSDDAHTLEVTRDGALVARLLSTTVTSADPALREAAEAAVLALENTRLRAQTVVQLAEVRASRHRIVAAQYEERRRLERDLHDGAQQRLMATLLTLSLAAQAAEHDPELAGLVTQAGEEVTAAMRDVRALAHGLHPAVLAEEGLVAAVEAVADRSAATVLVDVPDSVADALTEDQSTAVYFGVCECLTNAVRYGAERVTVRGSVSGSTARVVVEDNGPGGAWIRPGGGLAGLADRLAAEGGALAVSSSERGTAVALEVPCGR
jgi:signal transduction histidine kinase